MSSIDTTLAERGSRYGEFTDHAVITQNIKASMAQGRNWSLLEDDMKEALEMVAHKVGRILNGDPTYIDSWTDIIGYTRLVEKRLIDEQEAVKALLSNVVPLDTRSDRNTAAAKPVDGELKAPPEEACNCPGCTLEALFNRAVVRGNS